MTDEVPALVVKSGRAFWTARRTWWAALLTAAAALVPLVIASARLAPCLLGMLPARPTGGVGAEGASGAAAVGPVTCPWSWQALLCRPLAELAVWLQPTAGARSVSPVVALLSIPTVVALLLGSLGVVRATRVWAVTLVRASIGARVIDRIALPGSHVAPRRVAALVGAAGLRGRQVRVLEDTRPLAWTYGLWRPRVALSTGLLAQLDDAALAAVLTHEAAHVHHRDPLRRLISESAMVACPHAPALQALDAHLRLRQELEADEVAASSRGAAAVARALIGVSALIAPAASPAHQTAPVGSGDTPTRRRMRCLAATGSGSDACSRRAPWTGVRGRSAADTNGEHGAAAHHLTCRVDHLLGRATAADLLMPTIVFLSTGLGLVTMWCLFAW